MEEAIRNWNTLGKRLVAVSRKRERKAMTPFPGESQRKKGL